MLTRDKHAIFDSVANEGFGIAQKITDKDTPCKFSIYDRNNQEIGELYTDEEGCDEVCPYSGMPCGTSFGNYTIIFHQK
jgi:hypothetical protein